MDSKVRSLDFQTPIPVTSGLRNNDWCMPVFFCKRWRCFHRAQLRQFEKFLNAANRDFGFTHSLWEVVDSDVDV